MRDLARLPKAHLHVHLENCVRWSSLFQMGEANGIDVPEAVSEFRGGFTEFADHNTLVRGCLQTAADFERIGLEFCEDEAAQGARYAEVTFTAAAHGERLGQLEMPLEGVLRGLAAGRQRYGIECQVLLDHSRRRSVERMGRTLELARSYAAQGVVGIGLAGDEVYPLAPFVDVLDAARADGVHLVHHAGETCGPESIRDAIERGHTERLGHGIRVLDDAALVDEVRRRGLALEVCPTSNIALGLVSSMRSHPLPRLRDAGLRVTVNTDIPVIVGTTLTEEYARTRDAFEFEDQVMAELAGNAVDASFASEATKTRLRAAIAEWLAAGS